MQGAEGLSDRLQETLSGVRTVQAFRNEPYELNRLDTVAMGTSPGAGGP
jgi:hypothetical protein